jgi:hypothetical protein
VSSSGTASSRSGEALGRRPLAGLDLADHVVRDVHQRGQLDLRKPGPLAVVPQLGAEYALGRPVPVVIAQHRHSFGIAGMDGRASPRGGKHPA